MTRLQSLPALVVLAFALSASCGSSDKPGGTGGAGGSTGGSGGATAGSGGSAGAGGSGGSGGASGSGGSAGRDGAPPPPPPPPAGGSGGSDAAPGGQGGRGGSDAAADTGGAAAPTWDSFAKGFFTSYCVSCHNDDNSGAAARDYHLLTNVMREKAEIACGVATPATAMRRGCTGFPPARQFPIGTLKPSDADRDRLVQWIEAGTP